MGLGVLSFPLGLLLGFWGLWWARKFRKFPQPLPTTPLEFSFRPPEHGSEPGRGREPEPGPKPKPEPEPHPKPEPEPHPKPCPEPEPCPKPCPEPCPKPCPEPCPPVYKIPDQLGEKDLTGHIAVQLMGTAANGVPLPDGVAPPNKVIWVDHGNEVLVHLDSTQVKVLDRMVLVSVDLETDQTGRTPLVCSFAVGGPGELGGLVATTDDVPHGLGLLASAWGKQLQTAVWSTLMGLANDHASERSLTPRGLAATAGQLHLAAGKALTQARGGRA